MKLLCVSDVHAKMASVEKLVKTKPSCDVVVVAGDITDFGGAKEAEAVLKLLGRISSELVAVPGNCDKMGVNEYLAESGYGIHGGGRIIGNVGFFGVGGSNLTPFGTPQEYSEEKIYELLGEGYKTVAGCGLKVLVSHPPPYTTKLDIARGGTHVGSRNVRRFLEENSVDLVVTGHMHEDKGVDQLGKTTMLNPGPLHMGYAIVGIGGSEAEVEFYPL